MKLVLALLVLPLALFPSLAPLGSSDPTVSASEDDNPVAWLEGHWIGEGFGGEAEEIWLAPKAGTMSCIFRLSQKDEVSFYELVTVGRGAEGWEMRLKHFHADLRGWEERDESLVWPYEPIGKRAARFGPVTYELSERGVLRAIVEVDRGNGAEPQELVFRRKE